MQAFRSASEHNNVWDCVQASRYLITLMKSKLRMQIYQALQ